MVTPGWNWSSAIPEQLPVPHTCPWGHPQSQGRPLHLPGALGMLSSITENRIPGLQPHPEPTGLALSHPLAAIPYKMFLLWQEIRCSGVFRISYVRKKLMYKWVKKMQRQESSEIEEKESSFGNGRTSNPCSGNSQLDIQGSSGRTTQDGKIHRDTLPVEEGIRRNNSGNLAVSTPPR